MYPLFRRSDFKFSRFDRRCNYFQRVQYTYNLSEVYSISIGDTMSDLTIDEFWFLRIYENYYGFLREPKITDVEIDMMGLEFYGTKTIINSLIEKKVLKLSERGQELGITRDGLEIYRMAKRIQEKWECHPISNISYIDSRDALFIRSGEKFKANRIIRQIFEKAKKEIFIVDPYIGARLFDLLEESHLDAKVKVLSSDRIQKSLISSYLDFKTRYSLIAMRVIEYSNVRFHDRFIFLDSSIGFHSGHSFKDLGDKDSQINLIRDPQEHIQIFKDTWKIAEDVLAIQAITDTKYIDR